MTEFLWLVPLGFVAGVYGTFIGAGGGFVIMPILLLLFTGVSHEVLTAISLAVIVCNSAVGTYAYGRQRRVDYKSGLILASATIPGAILGAMSTGFMPRPTFDFVFGAVLVAVSIFLCWKLPPEEGELPALTGASGAGCAPNRLGTYNLKLGLGLSAGIGYASSILGIGGGIIHVPVLSRILKFPVHVATATSQFILLFMALAGTATHVVHGTLDGSNWTRVMALAVGVVPGSFLGAAVSQRVHGKWVLRALALALLVVGLRVLLLAFQNRG